MFLRSINMWYFIYSFALFTFYGYITNLQCDQLSLGLVAQLVEHCTSIAEVMCLKSCSDLNFFFFRLSFCNCLSCLHNCDDQSCLHMFLRSTNIRSFVYSFAWIIILVNNYSLKWRWIVMDIYWVAKQQGIYTPLLSTLRWIIVLVYTAQANNEPIQNLFIYFNKCSQSKVISCRAMSNSDDQSDDQNKSNKYK